MFSAMIDDPFVENIEVKMCLMLNLNNVKNDPWDCSYFLLLSESRSEATVFHRVGYLRAWAEPGLKTFLDELLDTPKQTFIVVYGDVLLLNDPQSWYSKHADPSFSAPQRNFPPSPYGEPPAAKVPRTTPAAPPSSSAVAPQQPLASQGQDESQQQASTAMEIEDLDQGKFGKLEFQADDGDDDEYESSTKSENEDEE
jgi:hypothetical protein